MYNDKSFSEFLRESDVLSDNNESEYVCFIKWYSFGVFSFNEKETF